MTARESRQELIERLFSAYFGEDYDDHYYDLVVKLDRELAEWESQQNWRVQ